MRSTLVSISGIASGVGKTALVCDLLGLNPGWEAIKVSRGHYRSCGKNSEACCMSNLLRREPVVLSGRSETYGPGKDTGRYWEAGASNVHWAICADDQVEEGVKIALGRVDAAGVFIEGTSVLKYIRVDYAIMVSDLTIRDIKSSAVRIIPRIDALYVNDFNPDPDFFARFRDRLAKRGGHIGEVPVHFRQDLDAVAAKVRRAHLGRVGEPA